MPLAGAAGRYEYRSCDRIFGATESYPYHTSAILIEPLMHQPAQREALKRWKMILAEEGLPTRLIEAGEQSPVDVLLVGALADEQNVVVQLELSFVPATEEEFGGASLLQFFAPFADVLEGNEPSVARLVLALNSRLPLVGFSTLEEERMLLFRHMAMLPGLDTTIDPLVAQTVWMISSILDIYAAPLAEVAAGSKSYDDALNEEQIRALIV